MERLFSLPMSAYSIKYLIEKSFFAVSLLLKLVSVTVATADIGSLKSLHSLKIFVPHAG